MPRDYEDRSHIWPIGQAPCGTGKAVLVCGTVASVQEMRPRRGLSILKVMVSDGTGAAELVWFNQAFKKRQFHVGLTLTAFGKMEWAYGRRQMNTPDTEEGRAGGDGFVPVYGLTDGLRQQDISKAVRQALDHRREHRHPARRDLTAVSRLLPPCRRSKPMSRYISLILWRNGNRPGASWPLKSSSTCSSACSCVGAMRQAPGHQMRPNTAICSRPSMTTCPLP